MDSINPWLDVEELNRLAQALIDPVQAEEQKEHIAEVSVPPSHASKALAKASQRAQKAGVIKASAVRQETLPELSAWLTEHAACEGVCVVRPTGDVVHSAMPNEAWVQLITSITATGKHLQEGASPSLRLKVSAERFLQCIGVPSTGGILLVGLLTQKLLQDQQYTEFTDLVEKLAAKG